MKKLVLALLTVVSFGVVASNSYTKEQLNSMAASGSYPEQESPITMSSESVPFERCKQDTYSVYSQISGNYPVQEVVNTGVLYMVKIWTNDGAIMVSCSEPDGKKFVTQSSYK